MYTINQTPQIVNLHLTKIMIESLFLMQLQEIKKPSC